MRRLVFVLLVFAAGCGSSSSTTAPSSTTQSATNLAGNWSGTSSDSSGQARVTWQITQTAAVVVGPITITDTRTNASGKGTVTASLIGTTLTFTMAIPAGAISAPLNNCSITSSGTAVNVTESRISGTYSGNNSCTGAFINGTIALTK